MNKWFGSEGYLLSAMTKIGNIAILTILWLIGCIPIVTIGTATTALYYAIVKSVRRERNYPVKEFWNAYKRNLKGGLLCTVMILVGSAVLYMNRTYLLRSTGEHQDAWIWTYNILILLFAGWAAYVFPVLSRFKLKLIDIWKLAFVMEVRFLPFTAILILGTTLTIWLQLNLLPWPTILVLPGLWCFIASFIVEKALKAYTPEPEEGEQVWYDE